VTCILFCGSKDGGGTVFADSKILKGDEVFTALSKIHGLAEPIALKNKKLEIDDKIYGWVSAGATVNARNFVTGLRNFERSDLMLMAYNLAESFGLYNYANHFELFLFGAKSNYRYNWEEGSVVFEAIPHTTMFTTGSGGQLVHDDVKAGMDPLRAIYKAAYIDKCTGGMIDVWELDVKPDGTATFDRVGLCKELTDEQIVTQILPTPKEKHHFDYVSPASQTARVLTLLNLECLNDLVEVSVVWADYKKRKAKLAAKQTATSVQPSKRNKPTPRKRKTP
jgi:hypothetical protein